MLSGELVASLEVDVQKISQVVGTLDSAVLDFGLVKLALIILLPLLLLNNGWLSFFNFLFLLWLFNLCLFNLGFRDLDLLLFLFGLSLFYLGSWLLESTHHVLEEVLSLILLLFVEAGVSSSTALAFFS